MSVASAEALIADALMNTPFQEMPSPYVVARLAEHVGSAGMWQELADRPYLLDTLDPDSVAAAALRTAYGRTALPGSIAASLSARHLFKRLEPPDRLMTRWIAAACGRAEVGEGVPAWANIGDREPAHVVLAGHGRPVTSLAVLRTADGVVLASAGADATVRIWDPVTGRPARERLDTGGMPVTTIVGLTAAEGLVAGVTAGGGLRLWRWQTGEELPAQPSDRTTGRGLLAVLRQPDGREFLCSGTDRGTLRFWEPGSDGGMTPAGSLDPRAPVRMITSAVRDDGRSALVTAGYDGSVHLWDVPSATLLGSRAYSTGSIEYLHGAGDGLLIADDARLDLIEVDGDQPFGMPISGVRRSRPGPLCAALFGSPGEPTLLAAGDRSGLIRLWRSHGGGWQPASTMTGHDGAVTAMATLTLPDGRGMLATGGADGTVRLWHPSPEPEALTAPHGRVTICAMLRLGGVEALTTATDRGVVQTWDAGSGLPAQGPSLEHRGVVYALTAVDLGDGETVVATAGTERVVRVESLRTRRVVSDPATRHQGTVYALTVFRTIDGSPRLASAGADRTVRLWDPATGRSAGGPLRGHRAAIRHLAVLRSPGRQDRLVSAGRESVLRLWHPADPEGYVAAEIDLGSEVRAIAANGGLLLAGTSDGEVRQIDGDGRTRSLFAVDSDSEPTTLAVTGGPAEPLIAVGTSSGEMQLWSLRSRRRLRTTLLPLGQRPEEIIIIGRRIVVRTQRGFLGCAIDPRLFPVTSLSA